MRVFGLMFGMASHSSLMFASQNITLCVCCARTFKKVLVYPCYWDLEFTPLSVAEENM